MKNTNAKTLGRQAAKLVSLLYERGRAVFRLRDVQEALGATPYRARDLARRLVQRGVATRIKPGLYALVPYELGSQNSFASNPLVVARELMDGRDYFLSHATAMDLHGMLTQPSLVVTLTSPKERRSVSALGVEYRFVRCKPKHFFGFVPHWATPQEKVRVSDLERTVLDGLKQPEHCGGVSEVAKGLWMRRSDLDVPKLVEYAKRLDVEAVIRRLGCLLELYNIGSGPLLDSLSRGLSASHARLDPLLPPEGKFDSRWRLRLNVTPEELRAVTGT